jgi:hypothetical protein
VEGGSLFAYSIARRTFPTEKVSGWPKGIVQRHRTSQFCVFF